MSNEPPLTMQELREYDEAGYRTIGSLWPGDSFTTLGETYEVQSIKEGPGRIEDRADGTRRKVRQVVVKTMTPVGEPTKMTNLDGDEIEVQPYKTFSFHPMLLFPSAISDEHFQAEGGASWVDSLSAGGMW